MPHLLTHNDALTATHSHTDRPFQDREEQIELEEQHRREEDRLYRQFQEKRDKEQNKVGAKVEQFLFTHTDIFICGEAIRLIDQNSFPSIIHKFHNIAEVASTEHLSVRPDYCPCRGSMSIGPLPF